MNRAFMGTEIRKSLELESPEKARKAVHIYNGNLAQSLIDLYLKHRRYRLPGKDHTR